MINLAFGVTTRHDPSSSAATVFPALEMERAGVDHRSAQLFDRRDCLWCQSADVYAEINSIDDAPRPCPPVEGARCAQRQKLQPAPPRTAATGRGRRARGRYALGGRGRLALRDGHDIWSPMATPRSNIMCRSMCFTTMWSNSIPGRRSATPRRWS